MYYFFVHVGLLSNRGYVVNNQDEETQQQAQSQSTPQSKPPNNLRKLQRAVLSTPGKVVSLSILNKKGIFKRETGGLTGRDLMLKVTNKLKRAIISINDFHSLLYQECNFEKYYIYSHKFLMLS